MKTWIIRVLLVLAFGMSHWAIGNASDDGHGSHGGHKAESKHKTMDHSAMGGTFFHEAVVDGVRTEFQVMSLASMKMNDPDGNTHHVMAKFFDETSKDQIKNAAGKIKVIAPSGKEQVATLKDYSGIFAANFTIEQKGKYGIICLFKIGDKKRVAKFWYKHGS